MLRRSIRSWPRRGTPMPHRNPRSRCILNAMIRELAAFALLSSLALAQHLTPPADARARVDRIFARYNSTTTPGCAVGATIAGETVLSAGYGMADLEHDVRITPD